MTPQLLPNEILIQIAAEAASTDEWTFYFRASNPHKIEKLLWKLCTVNRLFCYEARKVLLKDVQVFCDTLSKDIEFLHLDHIARHILVLRLGLDPRVILGEAHLTLWRDLQAGGTPSWICQNFKPQLLRLLKSLNQNGRLREIMVDLPSNTPELCRKGIYVSLREGLSTISLPNLESLHLDLCNMKHAAVLWEPEGFGKDVQSNCKRLVCDGKFDSGGKALTFRKLELWIKGMERLAELVLKEVWSVEFTGTVEERLHVLEFGKLTHLTDLTFTDIDIGGSLSRLLRDIRDGGGRLKKISLSYVQVDDKADNWAITFDTCAEMPTIRSFGVVGLAYYSTSDCCSASLCSPLEQDRLAMTRLRQELLRRKVVDLDLDLDLDLDFESSDAFSWLYCNAVHEAGSELQYERIGDDDSNENNAIIISGLSLGV